MRIRGPSQGSSRVATNNGRNAAAIIVPTMAHNNQAGKLAPAIFTTGSHPGIVRSAIAAPETSDTESRVVT
jgi:hypothetical protein